MTVDVVQVIDWITRVSLAASLARVALHWAKDGLAIWIEPGASFWNVYAKLEASLGWLSVSLSKYGKREQVAEEAIKDVLEHPVGQEVSVTVTPVEPVVPKPR
jgi:hypothetical protein